MTDDEAFYQACFTTFRLGGRGALMELMTQKADVVGRSVPEARQAVLTLLPIPCPACEGKGMVLVNAMSVAACSECIGRGGLMLELEPVEGDARRLRARLVPTGWGR